MKVITTSSNIVISIFLLMPSPIFVLGFVGGRNLLANRSYSNIIRGQGQGQGQSQSQGQGQDRSSSSSSSSSSFHSMSSNPFGSMLGDMVSSVLGGGGSADSVTSNAEVESGLQSMVAAETSWPDIRKKLETQQTPEERAFRDNLAKGYGVLGSPLHLVRLYDESNKEEDIRVTFYRDSASWCPYCQKVWLALEEKRIPYKVEKINMRCYGEKPASFTKIQPGGQIPVVIIDGVTYGQSNEILFALEAAFPDHKSLTEDASVSSTAQQYFRLERQLFSSWMYWLTSNAGARGKADFIGVLKVVESALEAADGPFFMGQDITLVDVQFTSFLERMAASLLFYKGFQIRVVNGSPTEYPAINQWFDAMETLPSYQLTKSDYYTHCWDLPPQLGGCTFEPDGAKYEAAINGLRTLDGSQGSWELPLQPHNGGIEPEWTWAGDEDAAKREAVERVSSNHKNLVKFAARGAGKKGMPGYMAPLSDPNAVASDAVQPAVDQIFRTVCSALLDGVDAHDSSMTEIAKLVAKDGGTEYCDGVVASIGYVRDRVGVPRDMQLPAARQLRAHLNWAIGKILDEAE